jgi:hypothetical protein
MRTSHLAWIEFFPIIQKSWYTAKDPACNFLFRVVGYPLSSLACELPRSSCCKCGVSTLPVLSSSLLVGIVSAILPVSDRHCHFSGARLKWKSLVWNVAKRCVVSCLPVTGISTCVSAITSSVCAGKCPAWPPSCVAYSWRYAMKESLRGWLALNSVRRFCRTERSVAAFTGRSAV